ncbi:uncharacterized protein BDV17DRAFT_237459 [Aspergillus undulatus]|uniref:uncharacterized protein n=1 Tax=Aspergillus undulatus TaxID=1810928 RepID=UPI003CCD1329
MSDFKARFRVIYDGSNSAPKDTANFHTHLQQYHVVAVQGLGQIGHSDSAWIEVNASGEQACWLSDLLPLHSHCARVARFDYSCDSLGKGISVADVKHLARALLDELLKQVDRNALDRIVFLGQDLGGLVIKQALSLALTTHQYKQIAAMTSLLVFFGTPHRVRSSESVASWMLFLAGVDRGYKVSWFSQTANMIEAVNRAFDPFKHVYRIMSIFGTTGEELKSDRLKWQVRSTLASL